MTQEEIDQLTDKQKRVLIEYALAELEHYLAVKTHVQAERACTAFLKGSYSDCHPTADFDPNKMRALLKATFETERNARIKCDIALWAVFNKENR